MALYILVDLYKVVAWRVVLNYTQTPPTHYYLESSGQVAHIETHAKIAMHFVNLKRTN
jgi:hypothetical protein